MRKLIVLGALLAMTACDDMGSMNNSCDASKFQQFLGQDAIKTMLAIDSLDGSEQKNYIISGNDEVFGDDVKPNALIVELNTKEVHTVADLNGKTVERIYCYE